LLLAISYGLVNPLFEAPDEHWHYFTAQTVSETGRLPRFETITDPWMGQEAAQPPLYYVLASLIIKPLDTADARSQVWLNPRVQLGDASALTNINAFVHTQGESWPWRGYVLAAHLLRSAAALLGLATLLLIYRSGRLIWPEQPRRALLATALVAFLPQFAFLHGAVSNDPLIVLLSAAGLWQLLRLWTGGLNSRRLLLLGITVGLAVLSKMAGLALLLFSLGFLLVLCWQQEQDLRAALRTWLRPAAIVSLVALSLSGWLLWRNWILYGDFTATNQFVRIAGGNRQFTLLDVLGETSGLWTSLFAVFGWFNVRAPRWVYLIWNGLALAATGGAIWQFARRRPDRKRSLLALLLAGWVALVYAGLVRFMLSTPAAQGRLLFPALLPLALGLAYGLSAFKRRWVAPLVAGLALLTSLFGVARVIPQAYARPPLIAAVPAAAAGLNVPLGHGLTLLAAEVHTDQAEPGQPVALTLYWQSAAGTPNETRQRGPEFVLEIFGRDDRAIGKLQSYHGSGLYPASLWPPEAIIADRFAVRVTETAAVPVLARLNVKLVGRQESVDVGAVKVAPTVWPVPSPDVAARIEGIDLVDPRLSALVAQPGETVTVSLRWQVEQAPNRDLTTFVHLGEPTAPPLAQGDSPPIDGHYPTRVWEAGEVIVDGYRLTLPADLAPGRYPVTVGLYEPDSGRRVPLHSGGQRQPHDAYVVDWLQVEASADAASP
ncbi:MAG: DUF2142 domain-containing protein, partial [Candidatus Promineifilaceae bacterium]|nr:DUF2142 domain-containing protein [Candidatus Promineifilaceae bacterium]